MNKILILSAFVLTSCNLFQDNNQGSGPVTELKQDLWNLNPELVECEEKKVVDENNNSKLVFGCDFEAFDIQVVNIEEGNLATKSTLIKIYEWMISSIFHGSEIYALDKVVFDGDKRSRAVLGSYDPRNKIISLFPNNPYAKREVRILKWVADRLGREEITTYDWEYWLYTLSHEYGHHQTVIYGSQNQTPIINQETNLADFKVNKIGNYFLNNFLNLKQENNKNDQKYIDRGVAIRAFTSGREGCETDVKTKKKKNIWPTRNIDIEKNNYYWTTAERLTRAFQVLTFQVPKQFHNEDSVNAYGTISDDYWWFNFYRANLYENYINKKCDPLQKQLDIKLEQFATMLQEKWFNEKDKQVSAATFSGSNQLYLFTPIRNQKIELVGEDNKVITLKQRPSFTNTTYNWRPFDSRKSKRVDIKSVPYYSEQRIPKGKYEIKINGSNVKSAFDLQVGETKLIGSAKKYFDKFSLTKDGLFIEITS